MPFKMYYVGVVPAEVWTYGLHSKGFEGNKRKQEDPHLFWVPIAKWKSDYAANPPSFYSISPKTIFLEHAEKFYYAKSGW